MRSRACDTYRGPRPSNGRGCTRGGDRQCVSSSGAFLILLLLAASRPPGADNSDAVATLCMRHKQNPSPYRTADRDRPSLIFGVIRISEGEGSRVEEYG